MEREKSEDGAWGGLDTADGEGDVKNEDGGEVEGEEEMAEKSEIGWVCTMGERSGSGRLRLLALELVGGVDCEDAED